MERESVLDRYFNDVVLEVFYQKKQAGLKLRIKPVFWYNKQLVKKDQLIGSFEYLIFKSNKIVLMHTAIEFAIIMTTSFIPIP